MFQVFRPSQFEPFVCWRQKLIFVSFEAFGSDSELCFVFFDKSRFEPFGCLSLKLICVSYLDESLSEA